MSSDLLSVKRQTRLGVASAGDVGDSDLTARLEQQLQEMQRKYNETRSYWSQTDGAKRRERVVAQRQAVLATEESRTTYPQDAAPVVYSAAPTVYCSAPDASFPNGDADTLRMDISQQDATSVLNIDIQCLQPTMTREETTNQPGQFRPLSDELGEIPSRIIGRRSTVGSLTELTASQQLAQMSRRRSSVEGGAAGASDDFDKRLQEYQALRMRIAGFLRLVSHACGNSALEEIATKAAGAGGDGLPAARRLSSDNLAKFLSLPPECGSKEEVDSDAGSSKGSSKESKAKQQAKQQLDIFMKAFHDHTATNVEIVRAALAGKEYIFTGGPTALESAECAAETGAVQRLITDAREGKDAYDVYANPDRVSRAERSRAAPGATEPKSRSCFCAPMPSIFVLILFAICFGLIFDIARKSSRAAASFGPSFQPSSAAPTPLPTVGSWKIMVEEQSAHQIREARTAANIKLLRDAAVLQASESEVEVTLSEAQVDAAMGRHRAAEHKAEEARALQKGAISRWATEQSNTQSQLRDEIKSIDAMQKASLKARPKGLSLSPTRAPERTSETEMLPARSTTLPGNTLRDAAGAFLPALLIFVVFTVLFPRRTPAADEASQVTRLVARCLGKPASQSPDGRLLHQPLLGV